MGKLRKLWYKFVRFDSGLHERLQQKYPELIPWIDKKLAWLVDKVLRDPIFAIVLIFPLAALNAAGVGTTIIVSGWLAFAASFLWIAKSERLQKLTILTRLASLLLVVALLGGLSWALGTWAIQRGSLEKGEQEAPSAAVANRPLSRSKPSEPIEAKSAKPLKMTAPVIRVNAHKKESIARAADQKAKPHQSATDGSERPFLFAEQVQLSADETSVHVIFRNASIYPALAVTTVIQWAVLPSNFDISKFSPKLAAPTGTGDVSPNMSIKVSCSTGKKELPAAFADAKNGETKAYLFGKADYKDLNRKSYEPRFCVYWDPADNTFPRCSANEFVEGEKP
jgi:hypothetical protein